MSLWSRFFRHNANASNARTAIRKVLGRPELLRRRQCMHNVP